MKTARISLAVVSGILLALGYTACSDHAGIDQERIVAGLMFGAATAISMIVRPERVSRKLTYFLVAPLILALIVHEVRTGTRAEAIVTIAVGIAFVGVQLAFASLPAAPAQDPSNKIDP
jgi:hypothetical protein